MLKKFFVLSVIVAACYACNSGQTNDDKKAVDSLNKANAPAALTNDVSKNPDYVKGLELIGKSDCFTCHKVDEPNAGPAYRDVANKYSDKDLDMLADKVIAGGSGVWGSTPMIPHPAISKDDAKQMVKYVLLLKNK